MLLISLVSPYDLIIALPHKLRVFSLCGHFFFFLSCIFSSSAESSIQLLSKSSIKTKRLLPGPCLPGPQSNLILWLAKWSHQSLTKFHSPTSYEWWSIPTLSDLKQARVWCSWLEVIKHVAKDPSLWRTTSVILNPNFSE